MTTVDVAFIQVKVCLLETRINDTGCARAVSLQTTTLTSVGFELIHIDTAGNAFMAVLAVWSVCMAATATITELDQLAIQSHCHRHVWVGNKVRGHAVRQVAARVFGGEIQIDVL